jgi:hypothetical protein
MHMRMLERCCTQDSGAARQCFTACAMRSWGRGEAQLADASRLSNFLETCTTLTRPTNKCTSVLPGRWRSTSLSRANGPGWPPTCEQPGLKRATCTKHKLTVGVVALPRSYWMGYQTAGAQVSTVTGVNLGAMNSSTYPYQHFVHYDANTGPYCVSSNIRHAYNQYKWW